MRNEDEARRLVLGNEGDRVLNGEATAKSWRAELEMDKFDQDPRARMEIAVPEDFITATNSFLSAFFGPSVDTSTSQLRFTSNKFSRNRVAREIFWNRFKIKNAVFKEQVMEWLARKLPCFPRYPLELTGEPNGDLFVYLGDNWGGEVRKQHRLDEHDETGTPIDVILHDGVLANLNFVRGLFRPSIQAILDRGVVPGKVLEVFYGQYRISNPSVREFVELDTEAFLEVHEEQRRKLPPPERRRLVLTPGQSFWRNEENGAKVREQYGLDDLDKQDTVVEIVFPSCFLNASVAFTRGFLGPSVDAVVERTESSDIQGVTTAFFEKFNINTELTALQWLIRATILIREKQRNPVRPEYLLRDVDR